MSRLSPLRPLTLAILFFHGGLVSSLHAQTIAEGLDNPATIEPFVTEGLSLEGNPYPAGDWTYTTGTTHDGIDAITSVLAGRNTSRLTTTVQGPANVSFRWKMTGLQSFDTVQFQTLNHFATITGNSDWSQQVFQVDCGEQPMEWFYRRLTDPSSTGQAWIDEMVVTPMLNRVYLQDAVENGTYAIYSNDWTSSPLDGALNSNAAKSGPVTPGGKSSMLLEIEGPATINFEWGMATEEGDESVLDFIVNDEPVASLTNSQTLTTRTVDLGPGTHCLKWVFERGFTGTPEYVGPTEGYVDHLVISTFGASPALADAVDREGEVYSSSWTRQTLVVRDGSDAAMVTSPELSKAQRLYVDLPDEAGLLSFWYKTEADPESGFLIMLVDGEQFLAADGVNDWTRAEINLGTGFDRVLQGIFVRFPDSVTGLNPNPNSPNTRVYLDEITFTPGATNYQPDLSIGPLKKGLKGVGVYNTSGAGQLSKIRAPMTRPIGEYAIRIQNASGTDPDTFVLRGVGSQRHFQIFYVVEEGGQKLNFSAAFAAGIFESTSLDPKASEAHEIWIVRKKKGRKKRSHTLQVIATSDEDPRKIDVVRTKLLVKKR